MIKPTIMKQKDIEILIEKYFNGETTPEEEKALALEVSREDAPQEWKIIAEMLGELTVDEALYDKMMAERNKKPRIVKLWPWLAAACVAGLLIVFLAPPKALHSSKEEPQIAHITEDSTKQNKVVMTKEQPQPLLAVIEHKAPKKKVTNVPATKVKEPLSGKAECAEEDGTEYQVAQKDPTYSSEQESTEQNLFYAALSDVRRNTSEKMNLCDMDCMNENIRYRGNRLAVLINEQQ